MLLPRVTSVITCKSGKARDCKDKNHIADVRSADAGICHHALGDDLAIMRINDLGTAYHVTVPAHELEAVGTPAKVRANDGHLAYPVRSDSPA